MAWWLVPAKDEYAHAQQFWDAFQWPKPKVNPAGVQVAPGGTPLSMDTFFWNCDNNHCWGFTLT
jgi:hypothetical protein